MTTHAVAAERLWPQRVYASPGPEDRVCILVDRRWPHDGWHEEPRRALRALRWTLLSCRRPRAPGASGSGPRRCIPWRDRPNPRYTP